MEKVVESGRHVYHGENWQGNVNESICFYIIQYISIDYVMYCNTESEQKFLFIPVFLCIFLCDSKRIWTTISAKLSENWAKQVEICWHYRTYSRKIKKFHLRTLQVRKALKHRYDFICYNLRVNHTLKHSFALAIILNTVPWQCMRFRGSIM